MSLTSTPTASHAVPDARYERYRVHQKDLFRECMDDARLIVKRAHLPPEAVEAEAIVALALTLFTKRCVPYAEYADAPWQG